MSQTLDGLCVSLCVLVLSWSFCVCSVSVSSGERKDASLADRPFAQIWDMLEIVSGAALIWFSRWRGEISQGLVIPCCIKTALFCEEQVV